MLRHFLLIFSTGFEGVLATYRTLYSSYFSHRVFGGDLIKMMMLYGQVYIRGSVTVLLTCVYCGISTFNKPQAVASKQQSRRFHAASPVKAPPDHICSSAL